MDKIKLVQAISHKMPIPEAVKIAGLVNRNRFVWEKTYEIGGSRYSELYTIGLFGLEGKENNVLILRVNDDYEYTMSEGDLTNVKIVEMLETLLSTLPFEKGDCIKITEDIVEFTMS